MKVFGIMNPEFLNDRVRIGPPAVDRSLFKVERNGRTVKGKREDIPGYLASLGLDLYEYNAGRGFKLKSAEDLRVFRDNCKKYDIKVTVHGPYYINLCSDNPDTLKRSVERIAELYRYASWLGASRAVFHLGTYGRKRTHEESLKLIIGSIKKGIELADSLFPEEAPMFRKIALCPETAGKKGAIGSVEEIVTICKEVGTEKCIPTIDFGHLYARTNGKISTYKDFLGVFKIVEAELGKDVAENLHIHYSKVEYTSAGEKLHHPNSNTDWGPDYRPLLKLIKELGYKPTIINESPLLEPDAKMLKDYFRTL